MFFNLPYIFNPIYNQQLREIFAPPNKNTVAVYKQITLLIICSISSRLETLLKITGDTIQVSNIPVLTKCFKKVNFSPQILPLLYII